MITRLFSSPSWSLALGFVSVIGLGACASAPDRPGEGGGNGEDSGQRPIFPDAPGIADADEGLPDFPDARQQAPLPDAAEPIGACSAPSSFASLGSLRSGIAETGASADGDYDLYWGPLEPGMPGDHISIELWEGFGPFAAGLRTGTFTLAGDDTDYAVCGVCALIATDWDGADYVDTYMAESGTITVSSITGSITGTLSNVSFRHVVLDTLSGEMFDAGTGCTTRIGSASFTAPLEPAP